MIGCDRADEWKGNKSNFTLGVFTDLCKTKSHASHKVFTPLESKKASKEAVEYWRNKRKEEVGF